MQILSPLPVSAGRRGHRHMVTFIAGYVVGASSALLLLAFFGWLFEGHQRSEADVLTDLLDRAAE